MAPTELLAEQHYLTMTQLLKGAKVNIALLTSSLKPSDRKELIKDIANGEIDIVVGTHALLTEDVIFSNIAVAITDEQHRFGVQQRALLRNKTDDKNAIPHTLVMTATPIPRTLSLTIFGDLDVSTINAMPPGRVPITTKLVQPDDAEKSVRVLEISCRKVAARVRCRSACGKYGFRFKVRIKPCSISSRGVFARTDRRSCSW